MPTSDKVIEKRDKANADGSPLTIADKNGQLGQLLLAGKVNTLRIVRIERLEIEIQGWRIVYRD